MPTATTFSVTDVPVVVVGVPVMALPLNDRPAGKDPADTLHVNGPTPVDVRFVV